MQTQREIQVAVAIIGGPLAAPSATRLIAYPGKREQVTGEALVDFPVRYAAAPAVLPVATSAPPSVTAVTPPLCKNADADAGHQQRKRDDPSPPGHSRSYSIHDFSPLTRNNNFKAS